MSEVLVEQIPEHVPARLVAARFDFGHELGGLGLDDLREAVDARPPGRPP